MQLVSKSLVNDLLDTVERTSLLTETTGLCIQFPAGGTVSGSLPAAVMEIVNSGNPKTVARYMWCQLCVVGASFIGNSSSMFLVWPVRATCHF